MIKQEKLLLSGCPNCWLHYLQLDERPCAMHHLSVVWQKQRFPLSLILQVNCKCTQLHNTSYSKWGSPAKQQEPDKQTLVENIDSVTINVYYYFSLPPPKASLELSICFFCYWEFYICSLNYRSALLRVLCHCRAHCLFLVSYRLWLVTC